MTRAQKLGKQKDVLVIRVLNFEFVSDFDIRILNLFWDLEFKYLKGD